MTRPEDIADLALGLLRQGGAQEASADAQLTEKKEFNVDGGSFSLFRTTYDRKLSLTAIRDHRRGVVVCNGFDRETVASAAEECLASAASAQEDAAWELSREGGGEYTDGAPEADAGRLFERAKELLGDVKENYPRVIVEQLIASHNRSEGAYANTHGVRYRTQGGAYEAWLMFSGHEGEKSSSFNSAGVLLSDLDSPLIGLGSLRLNLDAAEKGIHTTALDGKFEGTVLLTPDCLGSLLQSLLSNFVSDSVILEGTSLWKDKLGAKIADERLSVWLSPRSPDIVCGERYSSDGFPSSDFCVIRNGVLESFTLSKYVANKTGNRRAPNNSFSLAVPQGDRDVDEIIAGIPRGILMGRFSGGEPGVNGDFSGVAKNSFLIENGRVAGALSETMVSGNLAEMLFRIRGLSRQRVKDGMSALPWLAVDGVMISGK